MRKKIPKGTIPPGCRDQDVKAYQQMVAAIDGHNLARIFNRYERTCFPNEYCLARNYGQRIDHVIVQEALLGKVGLRVDGFKVLQEFGGGRRGCSDHCPLWVSLTAEESGSQAQAVVDSIKKVAVTIAEAEVVNAPIDNRPTSTAFMRHHRFQRSG
jgi:hypothetical protein